MNKQAVWAIAKKDMVAIGANFQVWLPMVIVPVLLGVVLPTVLVLAVGLAGGSPKGLDEVVQLLDKLPPSALKDTVDAMGTLSQKVSYLFANYMLSGLFLIIPLMSSSVIAADSFAGEKERGTLETLLFAPVDLASLFLGKMLAAFLPTVGASVVTFAIAAVTVNAAGWPQFHRVFFPTLNWLPLVLLVIPLLSVLTILLNIFISARVATFQAAYQMGGVMVLPAILLLAGQATGVLLLSPLVVLILAAVLAVIDALLLRFLLSRLDRSRLFESQVR
jgi:ABC-2 type transport system permease protein